MLLGKIINFKVTRRKFIPRKRHCEVVQVVGTRHRLVPVSQTPVPAPSCSPKPHIRAPCRPGEMQPWPGLKPTCTDTCYGTRFWSKFVSCSYALQVPVRDHLFFSLVPSRILHSNLLHISFSDRVMSRELLADLEKRFWLDGVSIRFSAKW